MFGNIHKYIENAPTSRVFCLGSSFARHRESTPHDFCRKENASTYSHGDADAVVQLQILLLLQVASPPSIFSHFWHICKSPITSRKLSNQSQHWFSFMEEEYDEELEKLLGEIPRATSAPPHLEEQRTTVKDHHQPSSEQVAQVDTPSDEMQTDCLLLDTMLWLLISMLIPNQSILSILVLPILGESQSYADHGKVTDSASSSDECADATSILDATPLLSTSCLPPSLRSLNPFAQNGDNCIEKELQNNLDKVVLDDWRLEQSQEMRFVQCVQSPLEFHSAKQLSSEQSFAMPEPCVSNLTGATSMHLGHQSSLENGAFLPLSPASFVPPYPSNLKFYAHRMHEAAAQQQIEEQVLCRQRVKEEFLLRQQRLQEQQARFYASLQSQPGISYSRMHHSRSVQAPNFVFDVVQQQLTSKATAITPERNISTAGIWASPVMLSGGVLENPGSCRYFLQGFCTRGDLCPFPHSPMPNSRIPTSHERLLSETTATPKGPRNGLFTPMGVMPPLKKKTYMANGHASSHPVSNDAHLSSSNHLSGISGGGSWKAMDHVALQSVNSEHLVEDSPPPLKYNTLKEIEGHIYSIAKDQHGCRFLQRKFEEGVFEDVQKIFVEIIEHVVELMTDPFGNYLIQKLLEVCDETQRMEILYKVTGKEQLVTISLNMHGTRAVQKLIETVSFPEQVRLVVASLKQGVVTLIKDLNGNHVVQRCLQRLSPEDSQFIFDAAASHCVEIATHRHGCCVLQRCVDFSSGQQRNRLVAEIAANALVLSQDPFGNYVVQYILDLGLNWAIVEVITHMDGNFVHLAMQKFSSNVVEKCLKLSGEESKAQIIRELMSSARLAQLLQDPFANYVVQSALMVSKVDANESNIIENIRKNCLGPQLSARACCYP
ncbi:hypothetical protein GOP47_0001936 [Adiantum capillus-veneris]|uniref:Uncharacterized protein n=1 Tax=Adiantum capillus-veneris TaxID=13818 RepID=A0A9D4ZNK0_ADICA|nr:hypothetical protein GOP47_0001936 [Adiantum capillus-veneris]